MKKVLLFLLFLFLLKAVHAQQDPLYSMYMFDKVLINPAYAGSSNWVVGTVKYRQQYIGLQGAPATATINIHGPIQSKHMGIGLKLIQDKIGALVTTNAAIEYSYHLGLAGGKLSLGVEGGILNQEINFPQLIRKDLVDNAIPADIQRVMTPDASAGFYFVKKSFYLGGSAYHLIKSSLNYTDYSRNLIAALYHHYFLVAGYSLELNKSFAMETNVLLKNVQGAPVQVDVNANIIYKERFTVGVSYRNKDSFSGCVKLHLAENIRVAYGYDFRLSELSGYSGGSQEIMVSYGIKLPPPSTEKEVHPRYYF